jgi:hypothetical protein
MLSVNPELTGDQVRQILIATADKDMDTTPDLANNPNLQGFSGDFKNGHSIFFGYGKVNALKAVERARALKKSYSWFPTSVPWTGSLPGIGQLPGYGILVPVPFPGIPVSFPGIPVPGPFLFPLPPGQPIVPAMVPSPSSAMTNEALKSYFRQCRQYLTQQKECIVQYSKQIEKALSIIDEYEDKIVKSKEEADKCD